MISENKLELLLTKIGNATGYRLDLVAGKDKVTVYVVDRKTLLLKEEIVI